MMRESLLKNITATTEKRGHTITLATTDQILGMVLNHVMKQLKYWHLNIYGRVKQYPHPRTMNSAIAVGHTFRTPYFNIYLVHSEPVKGNGKNCQIPRDVHDTVRINIQQIYSRHVCIWCVACLAPRAFFHSAVRCCPGCCDASAATCSTDRLLEVLTYGYTRCVCYR